MGLIRYLIFLVLFSTGYSETAEATHAFGAELSYQCTGSNQYKITFNFYRDCAGITIGNTMAINITNDGGFSNPSLTLNLEPGSPAEITPLCPEFMPTTCTGGSNVGVQEWKYSNTVTLPGNCRWIFSHTESARSSGLTTISGAGSDNLYVFCMLDNSAAPCDNSPVFSNQPLVFMCTNHNFCYNSGITDADGDSVVSQLITPMTGPVTTVNYLGGYSATQPLISNPAMTFINGILCGTPTASDESVTAMLVNEYRNGMLIGQVERDITLLVRYCPDNLPALSGFNGSSSYSMNAVVNDPVCFSVYSTDGDAANTTFISLTTGLPGNNFSTTGGMRDTATVCWTPVAADTAGNPHCILLTVTDNSCPYNASTIYNYCFNVSLTNGIINDQPFTFECFPDPVISELNIKIARPGIYFAVISAADGRVVRTTPEFLQSTKLFLAGIKKGIYFIAVFEKTGIAAGKKILVVE